MSVIEFVLFLVTLKTSSALSVFSNFAWLLLLCKQSSVAWSRRIEKRIVAKSSKKQQKAISSFFRRAASISPFISKKSTEMICSSKLFQVIAKYICTVFPKYLFKSGLRKEQWAAPFVEHLVLYLERIRQKGNALAICSKYW